jgi:hypothetical protein
MSILSAESALNVLTGLVLVAVLVLLGAVAARVLPVLLARFDGKTLRVAPPGGPLPAGSNTLSRQQEAGWTQLQRWCRAGARSGGVPVWQPWRRPRIELPLSVALMRVDLPAPEQRTLIERFSRQLDGSVALEQAGGRWAGLWLRLRVKRDDACWWRERQDSDPWDCGYLENDPGTRDALQRFLPRRATLIVAAGNWPVDALCHDIGALHDRRALFRHPVRVLVMASDDPGRAGSEPAIDPAWNALPCEMSVIGRLQG